MLHVLVFAALLFACGANSFSLVWGTPPLFPIRMLICTAETHTDLTDGSESRTHVAEPTEGVMAALAARGETSGCGYGHRKGKQYEKQPSPKPVQNQTSKRNHQRFAGIW